MTTLTFYRQSRLDGGIRMGIEIDGETVFGLFEEGQSQDNPVLAWFVNVEARGEALPNTPEEARAWFLQQGSEVQAVLFELADDLGPGLDPDVWPRRRVYEGAADGGVLLEVTCSAMRRFAGQQIGAILRDLAQNWSMRVQELPAAAEASL
jgi:hypothetical protein